MPFTAEKISEITGDTSTLAGAQNGEYSGFAPISEATETQISWLKPGSRLGLEAMYTTRAGCIICDNEDYERIRDSTQERLYVISAQPQLTFTTLLQAYAATVNLDWDDEAPLIHPTAVIHRDAKLGRHVRVGAYSVIDACMIGDDTVIGAHVRIFSPVTLGPNCVVREHCSLGGAGFGFTKDAGGDNRHIPHVGRLEVGEGVYIFPFSNIDRGTLGATSIGAYTVIDHYCHIGHNCSVGSNTTITAQVVMSGGSKIGDRCFIGVNTVLRQKAIIGNDVTTGMGAIVIENIPDGETWLGQPAVPMEHFRAERKFIKSNTHTQRSDSL